MFGTGFASITTFLVEKQWLQAIQNLGNFGMGFVYLATLYFLCCPQRIQKAFGVLFAFRLDNLQRASRVQFFSSVKTTYVYVTVVCAAVFVALVTVYFYFNDKGLSRVGLFIIGAMDCYGCGAFTVALALFFVCCESHIIASNRLSQLIVDEDLSRRLGIDLLTDPCEVGACVSVMVADDSDAASAANASRRLLDASADATIGGSDGGGTTLRSIGSFPAAPMRSSHTPTDLFRYCLETIRCNRRHLLESCEALLPLAATIAISTSSLLIIFAATAIEQLNVAQTEGAYVVMGWCVMFIMIFLAFVFEIARVSSAFEGCVVSLTDRLNNMLVKSMQSNAWLLHTVLSTRQADNMQIAGLQITMASAVQFSYLMFTVLMFIFSKLLH
jgi:hypothetical protein